MGGTPAFFNRLKDSSPAGCSLADWECVRASSYLYPDTALTPAQATAFQADGFEIGLHLNTQCSDWTPASLENALTGQLSAFEGAWPGVDPPVSNRTHCVIWSDWATEAKVEKAHGIRFDTNYYYNGPDGWLTRPGLLTGSAMPMRFADLDGSMIDVYQAMTQVTDETSTMSLPWQVDTLLDNALGSKAYYGVYTILTHSDLGDHPNLNNVVASAQDRGVPIVSSAQMLDWVDGRNDSSFDNITYSGGQLGFSIVKNAKARGLEAMLPAQSAGGPLSRLRRNGQPVSYSNRTVKGVPYVVFEGLAGDYTATYAADTNPPEISSVNATADGEGHATVTWKTDEPSSSRVEYGRTTALGTVVNDTARVTDHTVDIGNLSPATTYSFRVGSTDAAGNSATSPAGAATASFATPPGALVDSRTSHFLAGTRTGTYAGQSLDRRRRRAAACSGRRPRVRGHQPAERLGYQDLGRRRRGDHLRRLAFRRRGRRVPARADRSGPDDGVHGHIPPGQRPGRRLRPGPERLPDGRLQHRQRRHALPGLRPERLGPGVGAAHPAARRKPQRAAPVQDRMDRHRRDVLRGRRPGRGPRLHHRSADAARGQRLRHLRRGRVGQLDS